MEVTSGLRYKNRVRIMSESYVTLNFKGFVVKPCNGTKKLRLEATSELYLKNHVRLTSGSYVRSTSGNYVIKPCKWELKNT